MSKRQDPNYDGTLVKWDLRSVRSSHVTFGQTCYKPGGFCGPRIQRDYELVLLYSGSGAVELDNTRQAMKVGEVYLFKPGHREHFLFDPDHPTHHFWCSMAAAYPPPALRTSLEAASNAAHKPSELFTRLISSAFLLRTTQSRANQQVVDTLAVALFSEYLNMKENSLVSGNTDPCVARALHYMEDHLADADCLAGAQHAAGCSVTGLISKFSAAIGTTPARQLWRLRTERGLVLLSETGLSVAEVAYQCGFKNPFHFSRCVQRLRGKSPRDIRRRAWAGQKA